jgi:hypothetical protein
MKRGMAACNGESGINGNINKKSIVMENGISISVIIAKKCERK